MLTVSEEALHEAQKILDIDQMSHYYRPEEARAEPLKSFHSSFIDLTNPQPDSDVLKLNAIPVEVATSKFRPLIAPRWRIPKDVETDQRFTRPQRFLKSGHHNVNKQYQMHNFPNAVELMNYVDFLYESLIRCQVEIRDSFKQDQSGFEVI